MKFKKIIGIGDSWTFGEGSFLLSKEEKKLLLNAKEQTDDNVSKPYYDRCTPGSWVAQLAEMYGCDYEIKAVPGCSNETIMLQLVNILDKCTEDTLVVMMWSSKYRDRLFCLPQQNKDDTGRWLFKSEDMLLDKEMHGLFTNDGNQVWRDFKKKFITEMFSDVILDYYTMCFKIYCQFLLEDKNIKYIMCNAFEAQNPKTDYENKIVPYDVLNKKYYYKPESTMFDELKNSTEKIWEGDIAFNEREYKNGLHPNYKGYKIIAEKLKEFIDDIRI